MNTRDLHARPVGHVAALLLTWAFAAAPLSPAARAAETPRIENTAQVAFTTARGTQTLASNTVATEVFRIPVSERAELQFRRFDPLAENPESSQGRVGSCQFRGGAFGPLPAAQGINGNPLDPACVPTDSAPAYYIGEPVVVTVADPYRNTDATVREFVQVEISTESGDRETLHLRETGPDTGVFAGGIQSVAAPPQPIEFDGVLAWADGAEITVRYVNPDDPLDVIVQTVIGYAPIAPGAVLRLEQEVSKPIVEIGDFIQYKLVLRNIADSPVFRARIEDVLPPGLRFRSGSLRMIVPASGVPEVSSPARIGAAGGDARPVPAGGYVKAADPGIAADGRGFSIPVGDLPGNGEATVTFVAEVGPGARGPMLRNYAIGSASGVASSNETDTVVRMVDSMTTSAITIVGRVLEAASCDVPEAARKGIPNVRVLLDDGTYAATDRDGAYHFEGVRPGTHVAQIDLATLPRGLEPADCAQNTRHAGSSFSQFVEAQGGMLARADFFVVPGEGAADAIAASPYAESEKIRKAIPDSITVAGGGDVDWFAGEAPGHAILFPENGYNPRSPSTRVVVKHRPGETVRVLVNGQPPSAANVDGTRKSADGSMAVTSWRGLPLGEGDNLILVEILDAAGAKVAALRHQQYFAGAATSAELVPEQSILVADGLHKPVIAVRLRDRRGHPVRDGMVGTYTVSPPHQPAQTVQEMQERQLGASTRGPTWRVEGDDGIAYIELQPTPVAGMVDLEFGFSGDNGSGLKKHEVRQEIEVWLKSAPRDWVVVGFAKGSVGYQTLDDNMQAVPAGEDGTGVRGDGQVSLYAKGRVMGKWLLTMAYDSDKPTERLRGQQLLSTIDPGQYYTLYGDGSQQGYDASSARKLYLKLERDQFYALFGDFQSGLDRNVLSRYQRTLNGVKVEYRGPLVEFTGFAAETAQSYTRDEIQGDGTSGLYRLRHRELVLNSERVRIETRDRFHSEQIIESRDLARHIDYDIDYEKGTLFFREPIASRDFDFNPNWIVVEYETRGVGEKYLNGGGRVGIHAMDGRLEAGASYLRDEDAQGRSRLAGVDAKFRLTARDELRAELATTRGESEQGDTSGTAWLFEWQHRGERFDLLAYARRSEPGFGLGQQNSVESGMEKAGVQGQWRIGPGFSLQGEAYRLEDLANGATREAANAELAYRGTDWMARAGLQWAHDRGRDGREAESRQVTLGASKKFLESRLELGVQGDFSVGGKNESVDFPTRLQLNAAYAVTDGFRLLAAQEFTDGKDRDTSTSRFGFEARPWRDARLSTTLNQSQISEYGPRTFALFGLDQKFVVNQHWSFDVALDSSHAFSESGDAPLVVDPSQPIQVGGIRDGGALTEDFVALSGGATYRNELWMWNARIEARHGDDNERHGFSTAFLRQIRDGVAMSASAQAFSQHKADGSTGVLANAQLSWAYRPLGGAWSMLDKLEFRLDEVRGGSGNAPFGDMRSARIINNFVLNHASDAWQAEDGAGNVLDLYQRSQLSLYYGSRYVLDSFEGDEYSGYNDILGAEWRFDISPAIDVGLRASVLHSWSQDSFTWSFGPNIGFSPFANTWVTLGYNMRGFDDRDFNEAHNTAQGAYLIVRMKLDQQSLGLARDGARR